MNDTAQNPQFTERQPLTADPLFHGMVVVFGVLTTALPAGLAQPRFLPIVQALSITVFLAIPLRAGLWRRAALSMGLFLISAAVTMALLTYLAPQQVEGALPHGFALRSELLEWSFGAGGWPGSPQSQPTTMLVQFAGVCTGAIASAGLVGNWFLMRVVDSAAFGTGLLFRSLDGPLVSLLAIPVWSWLWISGLAALVLWLSQPILSGHWSPRYYVEHQRALLLASAILLVAGLLATLVLPDFWQAMIAAANQ
jgi:hypothetical protein